MAPIDEAISINAKRIETLTKVARLLGDQIKEQNQKIDNLKEEIIKLKEHFNQISGLSKSSISDDKADIIASSGLESQPTPEKPTNVLVAKDSDRQELLRALKIIDDL
ncbi:MAG: hypothetical protein ACFFB5_21235 [Promethearchaeota archaeon]